MRNESSFIYEMMEVGIRLAIICVAIATVQSEQAAITPLEPCLYADCGAQNVTPLSPNTTNTNPQKYRILSKFDGSIFIGGRQEVIRINPGCSSDEVDPWMTRSIEIPSCIRGASVGIQCPSLRGPTNPTLICDNYIRVVEKINSKLLVCGTGSAFPRCYSFEDECSLSSDGSDLTGGECVVEESYEAHDPYDMVARNWDQNTTLGYYGSDIFIGSSPDIGTTNSFVGKLQVKEPLGASGFQDPYEAFLDTYTIEARSVNEANFVGRSYEYSRGGSEYVLFFFRETAVEHINQGKIIYSRVARVCKNDQGNGGRWSSYQKARLNCSMPAEYPQYFDEIQDVTMTNLEREDYFYAVFTQPINAPHRSAVCIFSLAEIHNVFQTSQFKSASANELWLPINARDEPDPRPGFDCGSPSSQITFLQNNPLMNDLVQNFNYKDELKIADDSDHPLFFSNGARFSRITIDNNVRGVAGGTFSDVVIFIGTENGEIWKVTDPEPASKEVKVIKIWHSDGSPITGLEVLHDNAKNYLYATTHTKIIRIDLQYGEAQTRNQHNDIYDPYRDIIPKGMTETFSASNVLIPHHQNLTVCDYRDVILFCEGRLDPTLKPANATWRFQADGEESMRPLENTNLGHFIKYDKPRVNSANPLSFLVIRTHDNTSGVYECVIENDEGDITSERSQIQVEDCITADARIAREADYNETEVRANLLKSAYNNPDQKECLVNPEPCDEVCAWSHP